MIQILHDCIIVIEQQQIISFIDRVVSDKKPQIELLFILIRFFWHQTWQIKLLSTN